MTLPPKAAAQMWAHTVPCSWPGIPFQEVLPGGSVQVTAITWWLEQSLAHSKRSVFTGWMKFSLLHSLPQGVWHILYCCHLFVHAFLRKNGRLLMKTYLQQGFTHGRVSSSTVLSPTKFKPPEGMLYSPGAHTHMWSVYICYKSTYWLSYNYLEPTRKERRIWFSRASDDEFTLIHFNVLPRPPHSINAPRD